jgi:hypothetical protein
MNANYNIAKVTKLKASFIGRYTEREGNREREREREREIEREDR